MVRVLPFFPAVPRFPFLASYLSFLYIYMASSSSVPSVLDMAELRANGLGVPILFPIDDDGFARVSSFHLCIRILLHDASIWVKRKIYDPLTSLLSSTMREDPIVADNGSFVWELPAGRYRVYGLPESRPHISTEIHTLLFLPPPLSTPLPPLVSKLNLVFTLSYTFLIHPMVRIPSFHF